VVLEAISQGTPAVLVRGEDNAATEFIEEGVNGCVAPSGAADDVAPLILSVWQRQLEIRESTLAWFGRHAQQLSLESSLLTVSAAYTDA
jgi:hypothetical protein